MTKNLMYFSEAIIGREYKWHHREGTVLPFYGYLEYPSDGGLPYIYDYQYRKKYYPIELYECEEISDEIRAF